MRTATEFVRVARQQLLEEKSCILFADPGDFSMHADPNRIWPEMKRREFRDEVMRQLPEGCFSAPDELDDWTFYLRQEQVQSRFAPYSARQVHWQGALFPIQFPADAVKIATYEYWWSSYWGRGRTDVIIYFDVERRMFYRASSIGSGLFRGVTWETAQL